MAIGWNGGEGSLSRRGEAYFAAERLKRNVNALGKLSPSIPQAPELERRIGELIGEQTESRNERGPSPLRRLQFHELDLQRIPWMRALDEDRPIHLIHS